MADNLVFYKETEFKDTEIGKIPKEWDRAFLGEVSDVIMGQSPPSDTYNRLKIGLPFLQGSAEFGQIHPEPTVYCADPIKIAKAGDLLISVRAPVGDVNLSNSAYCIGRGIAAVRPKETQFDTRFGFYYLKYSVKRLSSLGSGSTFKAIRREELVRFLLVLPPVTEQKQIATILSTIDEAIQKTDELIAKTERFKKGVMKELLTKGIGHKEFKDTEIGRIPKEWEIVKLKNIIIDIYYGITAKAVTHSTDLRMLRTTDIKNYKVDWDNLLYCEITEKKNDIKRFLLEKDDLVIARAGTIGVSVLVEEDLKDVIFGSYLIKVKLNKKVNPKFLHYFLQSKIYWNQIMSNQAGSTLKNIKLPTLLSLNIPLPPIQEQKKIAYIISSIDEAIQKTDELIAKTERFKKGVMKE
ncbi:MAG: restriction endonuclease subunit S, partial [Fervidicoccaceae archaeon]